MEKYEFESEDVRKYLKDQITKQYKTTKESIFKKNLDFKQFRDKLILMDKKRYDYLYNNLNDSSIEDIKKLYKLNKVTPKEVVIYYLKRIEKYKDLNAIITLNPDIFKITKNISKLSIKDKPLYGIPVIIKDNIATGDKMPNTAGSLVLKDSYVDRDSFIVKKLRDAGAIIIGKANMSEWANFMTTNSSNGYSTLGGQTKNPYGEFDVGGSSSGSAVSVSKQLSTIAIGTETSGSLIYPANQSGVVALKPTVGLVSRDLIIPISNLQDTAGPIGNSVKDIAITLGVISEMDFLKDLNSSIKGIKIGVIDDKYVKKEYRKGDLEILKKAKDIFKNLGGLIENIELPKEAYNVDVFTVFLYEFEKELNKYLLNDAKLGLTLKDIMEFNKNNCKSKEVIPFGQDIIESSVNQSLLKKEFESLSKGNVEKCRDILNKQFKNVDILLSLSNYATRVYACAGYPAISVPAGFRYNGEPVGITLIGNVNSESLLLRVARKFEKYKKNNKK